MLETPLKIFPWIGRLQAHRRAPVLTAFVLSLILSVIAVAGSDELNRDGMLYVDAARAFLGDGLESARERFDWLFMPGLIAAIAFVTGLDPEWAGYALCALLLAATSAILVGYAEKAFHGTAWAACLAVLVLPAFNGYRDYIIREYGFWCFIILYAWLAMRWVERPGWTLAVSGQLALAVAAAFRVEALVFLPVVIAWQLYATRTGRSRERVAMMLVLPLMVVLAGVLAYELGVFDLRGRVAGYLGLIDPNDGSTLFRKALRSLRDEVLPELSRNDAGTILFFGLVAVIPAKFFPMMGLLLIPFLAALRNPGVLLRAQPLPAMFVAYFVVLCVFVTGKLFVTARYVSFLNLLTVPVVAFGCMQLVRCWPRLKIPLLIVAVLLMLSNVVSLSPKKYQYAQAGAWLRENAPSLDRVYVEGRRVRYHAGLGLEDAPLTPERAVRKPERSKFELFVVEVPEHKDGAVLDDWLQKHRLDLVIRFSGPGSDVLVLAPHEGEADGAPR